MRIAYCIPSLFVSGGMERVLTLKANYFADVLGYEIILILTDGKNFPPYYPLSPRIRIINLDINFDQLYCQKFYKRIPAYFIKQEEYKKKLTECLLEIRPDITISMLRREINFINDIQDGSIKLGEVHLDRKHQRSLNSKGFLGMICKLGTYIWMRQLIRQIKRLKHFIVLTHVDKQYWPEIKDISVIHNPLPFTDVQPSDCENKEVIAVGRLMPQKGFDLLIAAWYYVNEKHPDWKLKIYGEGDRNELQDQINHLNLNGKCILFPPVQRIEEKYAESSFLVMSSRFEGFGMVLIEAMACNIPVVSFDCPSGPREIIEDGINGFLVKEEDINQLAERICFMIENPELRKEMGVKAKESSDRFKIDHICTQWKMLFEEVLQK